MQAFLLLVLVLLVLLLMLVLMLVLERAPVAPEKKTCRENKDLLSLEVVIYLPRFLKPFMSSDSDSDASSGTSGGSFGDWADADKHIKTYEGPYQQNKTMRVAHVSSKKALLDLLQGAFGDQGVSYTEEQDFSETLKPQSKELFGDIVDVLQRE